MPLRPPTTLFQFHLITVTEAEQRQASQMDLKTGYGCKCWILF